MVILCSIAGGDTGTSVRLGLGMLFLQFAIGTVNDIADATADSIVKPSKPIPSGLVSRGTAVAVAIIATALGLAMAFSVGPAVLIVGMMGLADGLIYDLGLKGTALSWAPFAAGVGLLPVYAWVGATGSLPPGMGLVAALAGTAGVALALANSYADIERDRLSGVASPATLLGPARTLVTNGIVLCAVDMIAGATSRQWRAAVAPAAVQVLGMAVSWAGLVLALRLSPDRSHLVWEIQAVGFLTMGAGWIAVAASAGVLRT